MDQFARVAAAFHLKQQLEFLARYQPPQNATSENDSGVGSCDERSASGSSSTEGGGSSWMSSQSHQSASSAPPTSAANSSPLTAYAPPPTHMLSVAHPLHPLYAAQMAAAAATSPEALWKQQAVAAQQRYHSIPMELAALQQHPLALADRAAYSLAAFQQERERAAAIREMQQQRDYEKQNKEREQREKQERDRIERERMEKHRAEQEVYKHFAETARKNNWQKHVLPGMGAASSESAMAAAHESYLRMSESMKLQQAHERSSAAASQQQQHRNASPGGKSTPPNTAPASSSPYGINLPHSLQIEKSGKQDYMPTSSSHNRVNNPAKSSQNISPRETVKVAQSVYNPYPMYSTPPNFMTSSSRRPPVIINTGAGPPHPKGMSMPTGRENELFRGVPSSYEKNASVIVKNDSKNSPLAHSPMQHSPSARSRVSEPSQQMHHTQPNQAQPPPVKGNYEPAGYRISPQRGAPLYPYPATTRVTTSHHSPPTMAQQMRHSPQPPARQSPLAASIPAEQRYPASIMPQKGNYPNYNYQAAPPVVKPKQLPVCPFPRLPSGGGITVGLPLARGVDHSAAVISKPMVPLSPFQPMSHHQMAPTSTASQTSHGAPPPAHMTHPQTIAQFLQPENLTSQQAEPLDLARCSPNKRRSAEDLSVRPSSPKKQRMEPVAVATNITAPTTTAAIANDTTTIGPNLIYVPAVMPVVAPPIIVTSLAPSPSQPIAPITIITRESPTPSPPPAETTLVPPPVTKSDTPPPPLLLPQPIVVPLSPSISEVPVPVLSIPESVSPAKSADSEKAVSPKPSTYGGGGGGHKLKKAWLQRHADAETTSPAAPTENTPPPSSCKTVTSGGSDCSKKSFHSSPAVTPSATPCATPPPKDTDDESNGGKRSPSNSVCQIGSMAVNSISKAKRNAKKAVRETRRQTPTFFNGGRLTPKSQPVSSAGETSSSDNEGDKCMSPKGGNTPPKVKRKKFLSPRLKVEPEMSDLGKRKKRSSTSSMDSDKDSVSDKDSDASFDRKGSSTSKDGIPVGKKRGRKPKSNSSSNSSVDGHSVNRKTKSSNPFHRPPISQLKKTGESFLQDAACHEVAPKLSKCRECRWTPNQRSRNNSNIFCRFYAFRKLRYTKNGQLAISGFSDPMKDPSEEDLNLWLPNTSTPPDDIDNDMAKLMLTQVGDQLCKLLSEEEEALKLHIVNPSGDEQAVAWKRVVQGVREMCDVCETTLFNYHWACGKCGFVVCIDCYKARKECTAKKFSDQGKDRDELAWLLCTNRQPHEQDKLMLTQILAGNALSSMCKLCHDVRAKWNIPMNCKCKQIDEKRAGQVLQNGETATSRDKSPDIDLQNIGIIKTWTSNSDSDSENGDDKSEYSTLRELLIRPAQKTNGTSQPPSPSSSTVTAPATSTTSGAAVTSSTSKTNNNVKKEDGSEKSCPASSSTDSAESQPCDLKHFVPKWESGLGSKWLPTRTMTVAESKMAHPHVPHSWLCDGKLLRLQEPTHPDNYVIFSEQWKRGQPVLVSDVSKNLDPNLWQPESFARDFGDIKNDLVNCVSGNILPNQPMRKFWDGFEYTARRLKDDKGNSMLLKLKDWPASDDFAEFLHSRFVDLMKALPLKEYTQRNGRLNLASRLPDCFVRPDLGPKMYNAYGSALYPAKGTTNLHMDVSDAVNLMVYVGIPKDGNNEEFVKEAYRAIDEAGCDIFTRRRVREKGELPGALWHIYLPPDADKVRDLLNKVATERGKRPPPYHDPIHDHNWYLDGPLRERLFKEYGVEGYAIVQCQGDAIFIPAGALHQVRNLHNCIKVSADFVSPENISHCFSITQKFRGHSDPRENREDKLQIKNIMYHAVKESLAVLGSRSPPSESAQTSPASQKERPSTTANTTLVTT